MDKIKDINLEETFKLAAKNHQEIKLILLKNFTIKF